MVISEVLISGVQYLASTQETSSARSRRDAVVGRAKLIARVAVWLYEISGLWANRTLVA